jgi:energy-coupling factor transport system permease protein
MLKIARAKVQSAHPGAWWVLGLALAVAAGQASNFVSAAAVIAIALTTMLAFRTDAPWAQSARFYLGLAAFVMFTRVIFRIIFNGQVGGTDIIFSLPSLSISLGFGPAISIFGDMSAATLSAATLDGLRLSAIILSVAMANTLANPRKLLKNTPGALYEVATAISVAINLAPQLIESIQRVRRSRGLRGRNKGIGVFASIVIPALEDTMDRSLALAASMDARGFGRRGNLSIGTLRLVRGLSFSAAVTLAIGAYLLVAASELGVLATVLIAASLIAIAIVIRITSRQSVRTSYRKLRFGLVDWSLIAAALAIILWSTTFAPLFEQVLRS